jgi:hypothetical protein
VVDDSDLEPRALRCLGLNQVAGIGDVPDDGGGDPAADVALHQRLAQLDPEDLGRVDPAVDARDDVEVQERDERERGHVLPRAGGGEGLIAAGQPGDVGHGSMVGRAPRDGERQDCPISSGSCLSRLSPGQLLQECPSRPW